MNAPPPEPTPPAPRRRLHWLRGGAVDLGDMAVQVIAVVIGILLALFINKQVTQHEHQQSATEAMRAIRAELVANRAALHQSAARLTAMAMALRSALANRNQSARWCYQWDGWNGTNAANLVDAAYQTAMATQGLTYVPFEQAQQVAQAYGHQHLDQQDFDMIQNKMMMSGPQPLDVCVAGIMGVVQDERVLDTKYDALIGPDKAAWPPTTPKPASRPAATK